MIGDQNPATDKKLHWYTFLGRQTAFNKGMERIAMKYNIPVAYAFIEQKDVKYTLEIQCVV